MSEAIEVRDIGDLVAERDEYLSLCFVEDLPAYRIASELDGNKCILKGRTGSGKSGIIKKIIDKCNNRGYTYAFINETKDDFDYIVAATKEEFSEITENIESIIYKLSWHYIIILNMLRNRYPEEPLQSFKIQTDVDKIVYNFLKQVNSPSILESTVTDLFIAFAKNIKFEVSGSIAGSKGSLKISSSKLDNDKNIKTYSSLLKQTQKFISHSLRDVIGGDKVYILIDDLDLHWNPQSKIQQKLIIALFSAINTYLYEPNIKPIVALRTDIIETLEVPQREKISDLTIKVAWNNILLQDFIEKRILIAYDLNDESEVLNNFFEGEVCGRNLIEYMIEFTLNRPRDLLKLCKLAIEKASEDISNRVYKKHIDAALDEYSLSRVIALEDEWKLLYPNIESLMNLLAGHSTLDQIREGYTPRQFHGVANEIRKQLSNCPENELINQPSWFLNKYGVSEQKPIRLVETLYDLGIVILINEGEIYQQSSNEEMPKIGNTTIIKIHPMFSRFMEKMIIDEEDPWLPA